MIHGLCVMPAKGINLKSSKDKRDDAENPIWQRSSHSIQGVAVMVDTQTDLVCCWFDYRRKGDQVCGRTGKGEQLLRSKIKFD